MDAHDFRLLVSGIVIGFAVAGIWLAISPSSVGPDKKRNTLIFCGLILAGTVVQLLGHVKW